LAALLKKQFGFEFKSEATPEPKGIIKRLLRKVKESRKQHEDVVQASCLCSHHVWTSSQHLGVLTSRWDAEALWSKSFLMASVVLAVWSWHDHEWLLLVIFCLFSLGAFLSYRYHRRKQVFGRFHLLLALPLKRLGPLPQR
jgi:hypothetical protein